MQCCVPNCTSNEIISETSGITYHEFPKDPQTQLRWLEGLKLGDWRPNDKSVVCSVHLNNKNLMQTEMSLLNNDADDVSVFKERCRICLCSDRKLYNIEENDILQQYELLTASKDIAVDIVPQYICWECKARLASFSRLRRVALRSLRILHDYHKTVISKESSADIQSIIDKDTNNLKSLVQGDIEIIDYPPDTEFCSTNQENRNDNCKRTRSSRLLNKEKTSKIEFNLPNCSKVNGKKVTNIKNENDNSDSANDDDNSINNTKESKLLINLEKNTEVKNENDESASNNVKYNLRNNKKVSKPLIKRKKRTEANNEYDNYDFDDESDNFDNNEDFDSESLKDESLSQKSEETDYHSSLEDMIYDSDTTKSDNEDIINKVDSNLAAINSVFDYNKLCLIRRGINLDCNNIKNGKNAVKSDSDKELEEMFSIKYFTKQEQMKEFLLRKESDNYNFSGFKCDICYKGFIYEKAFKQHQIRHTDVSGPVKCSICGIHFRNMVRVRKHIQITHQRKYNCNYCDYVTCALNNARLHVLFHKGTVYECSQCDKTFQKANSLLTHVRTVHTSDIVCHLCGNSFVSEKGLKGHQLLIHKLDSLEVPADGPRCEECNLQFSNETALQTHYQESNKHKHLLPDTKYRKRKGAPRPVYANQRYAPKTNKKGVICELCNVELANFVKYRWHFKTQHPDKTRTQYPIYGQFAMCEICGIVCQNPAQLRWHKETHSETKKYSCEECGKQYKTKQCFVLHKEIHKGHRYACDVCGKTFSSFNNMKRHKIVHENLKFDCNICGKSFNHPMNRKNHITYVHLKKPLPVRKNRTKAKN